MPQQTIEEARESLDELATLCQSAGGQIVASVIQAREKYRAGYLFGEGKLQEIKSICKTNKAQLVIYDGDLTASQQEKLEEFLDIAVIDRPALILDIFARHARSREARTQVELAQLEYLLPRLSGHWRHLERQEAAIGTRGPGETQLETDRRLVGRKIAELKKSLKKIDSDRNTQRKLRSDRVCICLVGYTNAGKSLLFNRLTDEDNLVANRLFATLDSTTRRVRLTGGREFLLTDTVGFIRKLPVDLVASFRSTLKEATSADLLLHVVDFSAPERENKISIVNQVLNDIGAEEIDQLIVFNKVDLVNNPDLRRNVLPKYPGCRFTSALTGEGLEGLKQVLEEACGRLTTRLTARVAQNDSRAIAVVSKTMKVFSSHLENGDLVFAGEIFKINIPKLVREGVRIEINEAIA